MSDEQKQPNAAEIAAAQAQLKAIFDDGVATINDRDYKFGLASHRQRVTVFSFFSKIKGQLQNEDFSFLDSKEWSHVEKTIGDIVMFDEMQLSKSPLHWEKYPEDYLPFVAVSLGVISYPFMRGKNTA